MATYSHDGTGGQAPGVIQDGAERLEALAQVVLALGIAPESIQSVEIDWKSVRVNWSDELVPVLRMVAVDGTKKGLEQLAT